MASVKVTGSKSAPKFTARWKNYSPERGDFWSSKRVRVDKKADALKVALKNEAAAERVRQGLERPASATVTMNALFDRWSMQLKNRAWKTDLSRLNRHLRPHWGSVAVASVTVGPVVAWCEDLRRGELAPGTQKALLGLLSRALAYAVGVGLADHNVVRDVPAHARPSAPPPAMVAWIDDDVTAAALARTLPEPFGIAFLIGFESGARQGEIFALKIEDLNDMAAGSIRLAGSWRGPLKEDKGPAGTGKAKYAPIGADAVAALAPWLARRRADGAAPSDLVFPGIVGHQVGYAWRVACRTLKLEGLSWHHATRTSFCSRAAARGVPLEAIAEAVGHASTAMLRQTYMRFVRRSFDPRLSGGPMPPATSVASIEGARARASAASVEAFKRPEVTIAA